LGRLFALSHTQGAESLPPKFHFAVFVHQVWVAAYPPGGGFSAKQEVMEVSPEFHGLIPWLEVLLPVALTVPAA
jgi:hypothetical protein